MMGEPLVLTGANEALDIFNGPLNCSAGTLVFLPALKIPCQYIGFIRNAALALV